MIGKTIFWNENDKWPIIIKVKLFLSHLFNRIQDIKISNRKNWNLLNNEKGLKTIFLDFNEVKYVSSSFVASLLQIINKVNQIDVNILFLNLNDHTKQMVDSLGLAHFVKEIDKKLSKPLTIICKKCKKNITVKTFGSFECPYCRTLLNVSKKGVVR